MYYLLRSSSKQGFLLRFLQREQEVRLTSWLPVFRIDFCSPIHFRVIKTCPQIRIIEGFTSSPPPASMALASHALASSTRPSKQQMHARTYRTISSRGNRSAA